MIARQTGANIFKGMVLMTRRNTRRYGGYVVHIGVVVVIIGFAGRRSIRTKSRKWASATRCRLAVHPGVPVLYPGRQAELLQRVGHARRVQEWQED